MARSEFRDRTSVEVSVLDALVAHADDGMTVFDLRATVDVDIDQIEAALESLQADDLITVEQDGETLYIYPADEVVPDPDEQVDEAGGVLDTLRELLGG